MFCTQCRTAFETQWRFCRQCGYELPETMSPSPLTAQNAQPVPANSTASPANSKQVNLVLACHLVGVGVLLLLNPAVWKSSALLGVLGAWVGHYLLTVAIAGVLTGALTLFGLSTPWRTTFGIIVWIAAVLSLVGAFIGQG